MHKTIEQLTAQSIVDRRYLHQYPELSWEEFETSKFIRNRLNEINIDILDFKPPSVIGFLKGTKGDRTIALRADIDALPIVEEGDKEYISKHDGVGHLCGHDGHTAILLAVAEWLSEHRNEIEPNVKFIFQTSEEMVPSGAEYLVRHGVLDQVDAIFGVHLWQGMDKGKIGLAHGPMMASTDDFEIIINGKGGHGSMPQDTVDPIYISSHLIQGLQGIGSRQTDAGVPKVITVGEIKGGSTYNVIPSTVKLRGTIRTFSPDMVNIIKSQMQQITEGICTTFNAKGEFHFIPGTPPLINNLEASQFVETVIRNSFGDNQMEIVDPVMGGEDFSEYLLKKKGAFIFVGMKGDKSAYPHHHARFDLDEDVFSKTIELFINLVKEF